VDSAKQSVHRYEHRHRRAISLDFSYLHDAMVDADNGHADQSLALGEALRYDLSP